LLNPREQFLHKLSSRREQNSFELDPTLLARFRVRRFETLERPVGENLSIVLHHLDVLIILRVWHT